MKISKDSVLYNVTVLSATGIVLQVLGFIYRVYLSRMAGAEGLGVYRLVFPVSSIMIAATLSGVRMAVTKISAERHGNADIVQIKRLVRICILIFVFLYLCFAAPIGLLHEYIATSILGDERTGKALLIILIAIFFAGFEGIFESLFLGIKKTKYTAVSNLIEQVVQMCAVIALLGLWMSDDLSVTASLIALGAVISEVPVVIWLVCVYRRELGKGRAAAVTSSQNLFRRVVSIAAPVSVSSLVTNILSSASTVLLPKRLVAAGLTHQDALSALGVISGMAMPLIMLPMVLIGAMSSILVPNISQSHAMNNQADVSRKIKKSFQATGLIVLPATAIIIPIAPQLSLLLYHQHLSNLYIFLLAISAIFIYFQVVSISILNGLGLQKKVMAHVILGEAIQLLITYFMTAIPLFHIYGYIAGMIVSAMVVTLLNVSLIGRKTGVLPDFIDSVVTPLLCALALGLFTRFFYHYFYDITQGAALSICLAALSSGIVYFNILPFIGISPVRYYRTLIPSKGANAPSNSVKDSA